MHTAVLDKHPGVEDFAPPVPLPCGILVIEAGTAFDVRADGQTRFLPWGTKARPRT